jgi:propionyl-CoA carboxylase alpha chain
MRVVRRLEDLEGEVERARAEAASAFGDGTVFVEPYVEQGRHVEVQVVGTRDGVLVLGERDCSIQRRHQKVVEEAPAPGLSEETRAALHEAGRAAAATIGYLGAGTVEFLLDPATGRFWFLEMNTRLQVEHPVTELVHGVDLVAMQIAVAETGVVAGSGDLAVRPPNGHAIEVRLYAEDPAAGYQPQSGRLARFEIPAEGGVRVDAGFESGSEVSTHYDAMLAKVVAHAPTRVEAARKLAGVLSRARIHGVVTNRDQLVAALRDERFLAGDVSTDFLAGRTCGQAGVHPDAAVAAAIGVAERARAARTVQQGIPVAWRNVTSQPQRMSFTDPGGQEHPVEWFGGREGYRVDGVTVVTASADRVVLERDGVRSAYDLVVSGLPGREVVDVDSATGHVRLTRVPRFTDPATQVATGSLLAPMPGTVVSVAVAKGDPVSTGQPVLVLEAMKMQHTVSAPHAGVVDRIDVEPGVQVAAGEVLAVVTSDPAPEEES